MAPKLSVVIATYNRRSLLERLLRQLADQTLPASDYEVVVVDDGSREPVVPALEALELPYRLIALAQENAGPAAARHRGVQRATGDLLLITDDDMQVERTFLEEHVRAHEGGRRVAIGPICADPAIHDFPLHERWYAHVNERLAASAASGERRLKGSALNTGNVSMRREDYLSVGGFDAALGQSEDVELGLRLEKAGVEFVPAPEAKVFHGSDHADVGAFVRRARRYGVYDSRIAAKHPELPHASPWRYFFRINAVARPLVGAALMFPSLTRPLSSAALAATQAADRAGLEGLAFQGTSVVYTMEYFRGVRDEARSLRKALRELVSYARRKG